MVENKGFIGKAKDLMFGEEEKKEEPKVEATINKAEILETEDLDAMVGQEENKKEEPPVEMPLRQQDLELKLIAEIIGIKNVENFVKSYEEKENLKTWKLHADELIDVRINSLENIMERLEIFRDSEEKESFIIRAISHAELLGDLILYLKSHDREGIREQIEKIYHAEPSISNMRNIAPDIEDFITDYFNVLKAARELDKHYDKARDEIMDNLQLDNSAVIEIRPFLDTMNKIVNLYEDAEGKE